ncbi:MAG: hypothetical protein WCK77_12185, partial [Verrucomicrobiota bacterium]
KFAEPAISSSQGPNFRAAVCDRRCASAGRSMLVACASHGMECGGKDEARHAAMAQPLGSILRPVASLILKWMMERVAAPHLPWILRIAEDYTDKRWSFSNMLRVHPNGECRKIHTSFILMVFRNPWLRLSN